MNPLAMMKLKPLFETFCQDHPKFLMFLGAVGGAVDKDSIIEMTLTNSQGQTMKTNIKINDNDLELFQELAKLLKK
ncbi:hypothetical protein SAMN02910353_01175 [Ruminococcus sp. YRD2003]|uniref:hypothetical protein n=1 Tax=Ruminococcus sp. YRD2003 TaxID=1452313 RepID=UPI0008CFD6BF|nr:hypothetical protein [Ruminococcus sp.]SEK72615.1 hypothetical protein SAMN02910353_01175 [Ruminococcus flavefaciens]